MNLGTSILLAVLVVGSLFGILLGGIYLLANRARNKKSTLDDTWNYEEFEAPENVQESTQAQA